MNFNVLQTGRLRYSRLTVACLATLGVNAVIAQELLPNKQCSIAAVWVTTSKLPNGASPFSGYSILMLQSVSEITNRNLNDAVIVIEAEFPAAGYGGWFVYPKTYELPTGGATFPQITPNAGSVNPYVVGNPIFAPKRRYTLVVAADTMTLATLPANIRALLPANDADAAKNLIFWPSSTNDRASSFTLMNRTYSAYNGYTRGGFGGQLGIEWPKVTTYNAITGNSVNCATIQVAKNAVNELTPWNTVGADGAEREPFDFRGLLGDPGLIPGAPNEEEIAASAPVPNPDNVDFFRVPQHWTGWPGGSVPNPDRNTPDTCGNYVVATLNESRIALIRQPLVPEFANAAAARDATVPASQQVGSLNMQVFGKLRAQYDPGSPDTYAVGNQDIKIDANGGATFLIWPTTLNALQKHRVVSYAQSKGWNVLQGNLVSNTNYLYGTVVRQNGPASNYSGGSYPVYDSSGKVVRTGVGCYTGPQSAALDALGLTARPNANFNQLGAAWSMRFKTSGPYALQGVNCRDIDELVSGQCQRRLERRIASTGGQYIYTGPVPWVQTITAP